mmetsp:Transcript_9876/g.19048  ORF Transcript_9876/g.19048 Transcript_9876/m.19048 type:complete len:140 (-) Transcript_9876:34-453(-)
MSLAKPAVLCLVILGTRAIQLQGPPAGTNNTCTAQLDTIKASDKEAAAKCEAVVQLAKDVKAGLAKRANGTGGIGGMKKPPQWPHVKPWPENNCKQYDEILEQLDKQRKHCDQRVGGCQFDLEGTIKDIQKLQKEDGCK